MHTLPLYKTEQIDKLAWPTVQRQISLHHPALVAQIPSLEFVTILPPPPLFSGSWI